ncbi:hypothetical protein [Pseudomonas sp. EA_15y_Pfl1_P104]|uniref:hypothetical protein n=1 Tax=Pseudomonas sp. EA_15y_Pfl1_P104 TaxID=3088686 RepID=UPI0030DBFF50
MRGSDEFDPWAAFDLPSAIHSQAMKLLERIKQAHTPDELWRAAERAEGFALGIETVKALNAASQEALYIVLDNAAMARRDEYER